MSQVLKQAWWAPSRASLIILGSILAAFWFWTGPLCFRSRLSL
jgi:hypothetical protein